MEGTQRAWVEPGVWERANYLSRAAFGEIGRALTILFLAGGADNLFVTRPRRGRTGRRRRLGHRRRGPGCRRRGRGDRLRGRDVPVCCRAVPRPRPLRTRGLGTGDGHQAATWASRHRALAARTPRRARPNDPAGPAGVASTKRIASWNGGRAPRLTSCSPPRATAGTGRCSPGASRTSPPCERRGGTSPILASGTIGASASHYRRHRLRLRMVAIPSPSSPGLGPTWVPSCGGVGGRSSSRTPR